MTFEPSPLIDDVLLLPDYILELPVSLSNLPLIMMYTSYLVGSSSFYRYMV